MKIEFEAIIRQNADIDAGYIEFPFNVAEMFGKKGRIKVKVMFDGEFYRGSLVKMGTQCHIVGITKEIRKKINKNFGDRVSIMIEEDLEERKIDIPEDLSEMLKAKGLQEAFLISSFSHQREYIKWLNEAKKKETREKRIIKIINNL